MKIKLCGIRDRETLEHCAFLPVNYLGINFVPWSKRKTALTPEEVGGIGGVELVGVFADQEIEEIVTILQKFNLHAIQLHGEESKEYIEDLREGLQITHQEAQIWKAVKVDENLDTLILQQYCKIVDLFLFDGSNPGSGTQISDNKKLAEVIAESERLEVPYGIAGGINAENIADFVARFSGATLLDTASGLEVEGKFSESETQQLVINFHNA